MGSVVKKMARAMYSTKTEPIDDDPKNFFDILAMDLRGNPIDFSTYKLKGKKSYLIVNVASGCQLTNQNYRELNKLYAELSDKGLEILCFPCNQFYNREPKCNADIEQYLKEHFQPEFPVFGKIECNGPNAHPVYKYLRRNCEEFQIKKKDGTIEYKPIPLTFSKFLLDKDGKVVGYWEPIVYPNKIKSTILEYL